MVNRPQGVPDNGHQSTGDRGEREKLHTTAARNQPLVDQRVQEWNQLDKEYQALLQHSDSLRPQAALYRNILE